MIGQKRKFASSYLDTLGSGYDAQGYDKEQEGKARTEEVTTQNNWKSDKRDAIGRAASLMKRKRLARKLRRIAREIEAIENAEMDEGYESDVEETQVDVAEQVNDEAVGVSPKEMDKIEAQADEQPEPVDGLVDIDEEMEDDEQDDDEDYIVQASHPIEHDPKKDNPSANASPQMGDDEWISIGAGSFDDPRNEIGKASNKK